MALTPGSRIGVFQLIDLISGESPKSETAAALLARAHVASDHRIEAAQHYERAIALSETPRRLLIYQATIRELSAPEFKAAK